ncbi:Apyrase [Eumeta japonica]|uniref:Apyrase n=1 Tax=Eumeta variegata TaxID=151549 RepID=A0A4C1TNK3_EUMVA|nr:Apyrase [Eumeta japonica]
MKRAVRGEVRCWREKGVTESEVGDWNSHSLDGEQEWKVLDRAEGGNWHHAHFCIINQGGIRVDIEPGRPDDGESPNVYVAAITFEALLLSTPFENKVEAFDLDGQHILEMLEFSVANEPFAGARMLQVSGIRPIFDGARPVGDRVVNVTVRCIDCPVPRYEPLQLDKTYRVVSQSFIGQGAIKYPLLDIRLPSRLAQRTVLDRLQATEARDFDQVFSASSTRLAHAVTSSS